MQQVGSGSGNNNSGGNVVTMQPSLGGPSGITGSRFTYPKPVLMGRLDTENSFYGKLVGSESIYVFVVFLKCFVSFVCARIVFVGCCVFFYFFLFLVCFWMFCLDLMFLILF